MRWAQFDSTIVSLELLTVLFCSPICLLVVYGIVTNKPWRHFWQIVVNVCELYGGTITYVHVKYIRICIELYFDNHFGLFICITNITRIYVHNNI